MAILLNLVKSKCLPMWLSIALTGIDVIGKVLLGRRVTLALRSKVAVTFVSCVTALQRLYYVKCTTIVGIYVPSLVTAPLSQRMFSRSQWRSTIRAPSFVRNIGAASGDAKGIVYVKRVTHQTQILFWINGAGFAALTDRFVPLSAGQSRFFFFTRSDVPHAW